jgi:hypothetical protein
VESVLCVVLSVGTSCCSIPGQSESESAGLGRHHPKKQDTLGPPRLIMSVRLAPDVPNATGNYNGSRFALRCITGP